MRDITVKIEGDAYHLRDHGATFEVERVGDMPFKQEYESPGEALSFFQQCIGAAYLRQNEPSGADWLERIHSHVR